MVRGLTLTETKWSSHRQNGPPTEWSWTKTSRRRFGPPRRFGPEHTHQDPELRSDAMNDFLKKTITTSGTKILFH